MPTLKDVVCPFCGCLCDDIEVEVENNEIINVKNACGISRSKFLNHNKNRLSSPKIKGEASSMEDALDRTSEILVNSKRPLIYGLSSTECKAISRCIELAEICGGVVDNTSSVCHGPTILALQQVGESKATLGEIKNRADLVVFWGSNPSEAHLRHIIRYSAMPEGLYVSGRKDRYIVSVDVRRTRTAKFSDEFIKIDPNSDFELLLALRAAVRGYELTCDEVAGINSDVIEKLADRMKKTRFGIIFFGLGLTQSDGKHMNIDAAVGLVQELNQHTKFLLTPMRGHFNVSGANTVTTWQTGYPYAVDFSRGYPRYNPGEYTAVDLLFRNEADAALIVASDPASTFPFKAASNLANIPVITLDPKNTPTTMISEVALPVATAGLEAEGTAYRMDGVPLRLSKVLEPENGILSDAELLESIIDRIKSRGE